MNVEGMSAEISFFSTAHAQRFVGPLCCRRFFYPQNPCSFPIRPNYADNSFNYQEWTPIFPVPRQQHRVDLMNEPQLSYLLRGRAEIARYPYLRSDGRLLGYVVRLEDASGKKITPMLTYCKNGEGYKQWRFKGFGDNRPLYGLDILKNRPEKPVLVVEGEKTCNAARRIFRSYVVTTWSGGCFSVNKSNWKVLKNRDVTIWPDHDKSGKDAALKIADILYNQAQSLSIIDLPSTLPQKWDLADPLPKGLTYGDIMKNKVGIYMWF